MRSLDDTLKVRLAIELSFNIVLYDKSATELLMHVPTSANMARQPPPVDAHNRLDDVDAAIAALRRERCR